MVFGFDTEIKRRTGPDGKEYKVCNGTFYSAGALDGAILALEYAGVNRIRIRIFYASCRKEDIHKAAGCMENLSGYMRSVRLTKGGRL